MREDGEVCVKCGEVDEDRRTLWMACLYAMDELNVPFQQVMVRGARHEYLGERKTQYGFSLPEYNETPSGPSRDHQFFTLRVCKGCRADWMQTIERWFNTPVAPAESCGSGIFVRENGATKEITLEEWELRRKLQAGGVT